MIKIISLGYLDLEGVHRKMQQSLIFKLHELTQVVSKRDVSDN